MRMLRLSSLTTMLAFFVPLVAHADVIFYNGKKFDDRYGEPQHFTGEKSYRDNGQVRSREQWVDGVLDGPFAHYDFDGKLDETGTNRRGKRQGLFRRYQRGKLQMEMVYADGELQGVQKDYRDGVLERVYLVVPPRGMVDTELYFNKQGQLTGLHCGKTPIGKQDAAWCGMDGKQSNVTLYSDNGKKSATAQYLWGKPHGTFQKFNVVTGAMMHEEKYDHGHRVGEQHADRSGVVLSKSDCDDKRSSCTETEMFPGGKEVQTVTVWRGGKIQKRTEQYQNGKTRETLTAQKDHFQIDRFDDEGRPVSLGTYIAAGGWSWDPYVPDGTVESFAQGVRWRLEHFVAGARQGLSQEWFDYQGHKIRDDSEYAKDDLLRQKIYVDDKLAVELEYMPDGSLKSKKVIVAPPKGLDI
jgi:antitoxin component YwqK of YwqJK toxin-antitoxin module